MKKYTIKKGTHWATPWWERIIPRFIFGSPRTCEISGMFESGSEYELSGGDQEDVNKFPGLQYSLWPRTKKVQFGWRYNPLEKVWEILIFQETKPKEFLFEVLFSVKSEVFFECNFEITDFQVLVRFRESETSWKYEFKEIELQKDSRCMNRGWAIALNPYFGGNNPAPKDITFYLETKYF